MAEDRTHRAIYKLPAKQPACDEGAFPVEVAVILPTYNERENIPLVIGSLCSALKGVRWEAIFVDDDSPDGTAEVIASHAAAMPNIRLIHRVGKRGLSSACIDGMMASEARFLAVMDADMQHDERVLPVMLSRLREQALDVVVGTRNAEGGSMGQFSRERVLLSRTGQAISRMACGTVITDPMSGFFALRREFLLEVVNGLQGGGFKILVDLLASARRPVRVEEVGYTFRQRRYGQSKLDLLVGVEFLITVLHKFIGGILPAELLLYFFVGCAALLTYVSAYLLCFGTHMSSLNAQVCGEAAASVVAFLLSNRILFRYARLKGARLLTGAMQFGLVAAIGIWASVQAAAMLSQHGLAPVIAGSIGAVFGTTWNLSLASQLTWRLSVRNPEVRRRDYSRTVEVSQ